jgi:hypothetical protein
MMKAVITEVLGTERSSYLGWDSDKPGAQLNQQFVMVTGGGNPSVIFV